MALAAGIDLLGYLGLVLLMPDHIDPATRAALDHQSYVIGSVGEAYNEQNYALYPKSANFPEVRLEGIYGGLSWASIEPRAAVTVSAPGDVWAGVGPSFTKYWQMGDDPNVLFVGANFLIGYADFSPGAQYTAFKHRSGILFRSQLEFGIVISKRIRVSFFADHRSNASISSPNFGYATAGINIGYGF